MSSRPARVRLKRQLSGASGSSIDVHMDVCFVCKKRGYATLALLVCVCWCVSVAALTTQ